MFKSFRVGSVFGIPIKLDITLLIVIPVFTYLIAGQIAEIAEIMDGLVAAPLDPDRLNEGLLPWGLGLAAVIGLFIGVTLHELGHSVVALRYGYHIDSITLWLLGGLAAFVEQPREWTHEFWIAIAGPVVSLLVGGLSYGIAVVLPPGADTAIFVFGYLALLNIVLAVFNMIPAFPLDGGRVLRALYSRRWPLAKATEKAARIGKLFAVLLGILGVFSLNLFLIAVAFFVYMAGSAESRHTAVAAVFEGIEIDEVMTPGPKIETVPADITLSDLLEQMLNKRHSGYPVTRGDEVVGMVTVEDIRSVTPEKRQTTTVADIMSEELKTIPVDSTAMQAFTEMSQKGVGRLLVVDQRGEIVGLVTRTDLVRAFEILRERAVEPSREVVQVPIDR